MEGEDGQASMMVKYSTMLHGPEHSVRFCVKINHAFGD